MATMAMRTDSASYQTLRARLFAEQESLAARIRSLSGGIHLERCAEEMERTVSQQQRESAADELRRIRQTAADVNCAIARGNLGVFGDCAECSDPIKPARLEAIPWAAHCNACQTKIEREEAQ